MTTGPRGKGLFGALALVYLLGVVLFIAWLPHSKGHEGLKVVISAALVSVAVQVIFRRLRASRFSRAGRT